METLIIVFVWAVIAAVRFAARSRPVEQNQESLCLICVNAVVTRGTNGKTLIACNFAGAMRPVKFTVCECTGFCVKAGPAKVVKIEGFVRDEREVYAEVAVS